MELRQLQHGRRGICIAVAMALLGPYGAMARPFGRIGMEPVAESAKGGDAGSSRAGSDQARPAPATGDDQDRPSRSGATPTDLATVVVTANKRSERLQDVPMAVSALAGDQLEREGAVSFADYATRVPGLNVISSGQGQTQLVLRGITSGGAQSNATVGTYIDDAPYGSSTVYALGSIMTPDIDPADLQRIEVLRGPQGTLYGSNTLGGLVKFVTTPPDTARAYGRLRVGMSSVAGGGDGFDTHAMFNLPLAQDKLGLRVNAYTRRDPGFIDNVATGKSDVNDAKVSGARAQVLWTPAGKVSLRLSALAQNLSGGGLANGGVDVDPASLRAIHGDLRQSRAPDTGLLKIKYRLYDAALNADFGWSRLVSSTSYSTLRNVQKGDLTTLLGPALGIPGAGYFALQPVSLNKFTQELRLQSPETQRLEWRAGVFYTHERSTNHTQIQGFDMATGAALPLPTLADTTLGPVAFTEWAGYADLTWHATSRLSVLVGARYSRDRTVFTQATSGLLAGGDTHFTTRGSDDPVTYLFNPSFKFDDDTMAYLRVASGFRPGGPNVGVPPGLGAPVTFGPDKLVSYELGLKTAMLQRQMVFDVAAFYIDWSKIQLAVVSGNFNFLGNGGKARSQGVEAEWRYTPARGLLLSANASWTDAELAEDTPPGLFGYKGDRLPYVPRWNANVGIDYDFPLSGGWSAFVGANYRYVGARESDFTVVDVPRPRIPGFGSVDLRAGVNLANWTLQAYVKNLGNRRGITTLSPETGDPTASPFGAAYVTPRTVGVSASVDF